MISKNQIKFIQSLKIKKYRIQHNYFIAEGPKLAQDIIHSSLKVVQLFALESWLKNNANLLEERKINFESISEKELDRVSFLRSPNKVLVQVEIPEQKNYENHSGYALLLDNINDPGNLGTIIRIADWFGIEDIILSEGCADPYNPKTIQSTMGSIARIQLYKEDLASVITSSDMPVYAADLSGDDIAKTTFAENAMLIIGSESHGINADIIGLATKKIKIMGNGSAESLNAAIATGIICHQIFSSI